MNEPEVIAVILNYKRANDTIECVSALRRSAYPALRIIVVNNGVSDRSTEDIQSAFPDLEILNTGRNYGYAGGMNFGLKRALQQKSKYIFVANSDTVVERDVVSSLVDALESQPKAAAASGTIRYYGDRNKIWYAGGEINYWRASAFTHTELPKKDRMEEGGIMPVTFISGCAFLARASAIESAGLFDVRFFMYLEDTELCARFLHNGFDLLYVPGAVILHKVDEVGIRPFPLYFSVRNRYLFLKLAGRGIPRWAGFTYLSLVTAAKIVFWSFVRRDLSKSAILAIRDYMFGTFAEGHGLRLRKQPEEG